MDDPFVVIGGDAAGLSAASKFAREGPARDVVVFEKGRWTSYAHCGTPYFVKGVVDRLEDLLSLSPPAIEERGIDLRREHEVVGIDPDERVVHVEGPDGRFDQSYGDLLIATGAHAVTGPISGTDLAGVHGLHGLDDAAAIRASLMDPGESLETLGGSDALDRERARRALAREPPETVAIVGGGYVGVEMAEAFRAHDLDVHLFQRGSYLLPPFGTAAAERVAEALESAGVTLHLDTEVAKLTGADDGVERLHCAGGTELAVDLVLVGIGIRPTVDLVDSAGVELGDSGAIAVDDLGRTSVPNIYAAGDCAEMNHIVSGAPDWVPLGLTANRAGRAIGSTVAGDAMPVGSVAGTAVVKAFDMECGRTGFLDHDAARAAGFDLLSETITTRSRSGYYPGAAETDVTLTADRASGLLLGGAIAGTDRAAIRIDTLAMALESGLTVPELERADLAYAPPFSPVWDPVLTAAKVLAGSLRDD